MTQPRKHFESYLAVCPYYCREENMKVSCQGWEAGVCITVRLDSVEKSKTHKDSFCRSLSGCTDCPIHQMLDFELGNKKSPG